MGAKYYEEEKIKKKLSLYKNMYDQRSRHLLLLNMEQNSYIPITVTLKPHCPLFPLLSTALHSTPVCPMLKSDPDGGMHDTLATFPLLSVAFGASHSTINCGFPHICFHSAIGGTACYIGLFFVCKIEGSLHSN